MSLPIWDVPIGKAVGITIQNVLRHERTNYEQLLAEGIDRLEARTKIKKKIDKTLQKWAKKD